MRALNVPSFTALYVLRRGVEVQKVPELEDEGSEGGEESEQNKCERA